MSETRDRITLVLERRPDGGLRISSPDVPGLHLSHSDAFLVMQDVLPALKTIAGFPDRSLGRAGIT